MARFAGGSDSTDMFSKVGMTIQNAIKFVPVEDKQLAIVDNPRCSVARGMIQQRHFPEKCATLQLRQDLAGGRNDVYSTALNDIESIRQIAGPEQHLARCGQPGFKRQHNGLDRLALSPLKKGYSFDQFGMKR